MAYLLAVAHDDVPIEKPTDTFSPTISNMIKFYLLMLPVIELHKKYTFHAFQTSTQTNKNCHFGRNTHKRPLLDSPRFALNMSPYASISYLSSLHLFPRKSQRAFIPAFWTCSDNQLAQTLLVFKSFVNTATRHFRI